MVMAGSGDPGRVGGSAGRQCELQDPGLGVGSGARKWVGSGRDWLCTPQNLPLLAGSWVEAGEPLAAFLAAFLPWA